MLKLLNARIKEVLPEYKVGSMQQYRIQGVVFSLLTKSSKGEEFYDDLFMQVWNERIDILKLKEGEYVDVAYVSDVDKFNDRRYNRMSVIDVTRRGMENAPAGKPTPAPVEEEDDDDMPF